MSEPVMQVQSEGSRLSYKPRCIDKCLRFRDILGLLNALRAAVTDRIGQVGHEQAGRPALPAIVCYPGIGGKDTGKDEKVRTCYSDGIVLLAAIIGVGVHNKLALPCQRKPVVDCRDRAVLRDTRQNRSGFDRGIGIDDDVAGLEAIQQRSRRKVTNDRGPNSFRVRIDIASRQRQIRRYPKATFDFDTPLSQFIAIEDGCVK